MTIVSLTTSSYSRTFHLSSWVKRRISIHPSLRCFSGVYPYYIGTQNDKQPKLNDVVLGLVALNSACIVNFKRSTHK